MLFAPVMIDAAAFQVCAPIQSALQLFNPRYDRFWMPPLLAHPAVHCSLIAMKRRSLYGVSRLFQLERYVPTPASSRSLFVVVDVHLACCTRWKPWFQAPVSGADVEEPCPMLSLLICSSQNRFTRFRWLACSVSRRFGCSGPLLSLLDGISGLPLVPSAATYVHLLRSPALRLRNMLMSLPLPRS